MTVNLSLTRSAEFDIEPLPPFCFQLTVRKPAGWDLFTLGEVYEGGTLWTGIRFDGAPIGLKIHSSGTIEKPRLHVGVYTKKELSTKAREGLLATLAECLGAGQDLREFYGF